MKQKLTSRKFWIAVASIVSGIFMMFGYAQTTTETIAGAIVSLGGAIGYMITEGVVDSKRAAATVTAVINAVEAVKEDANDSVQK